MRTLLYVTLSYPPQGIVSSVRAARLVKHLLSWGWRCVVVAAPRIHGVLDDHTIEETAWKVLRPVCPDPLSLRDILRKSHNGPGKRARLRGGSFIRRLANSFLPVTVNRMPNRFMAWLPFALLSIFRSGIRPDAIFTSCSPPVDAIIGAVCKSVWKVPWVVEFRDLWSHNPIERLLPICERLDEVIERTVVAGADSIVTVSEELATELKALHEKPVLILENGHDYLEPPVDYYSQPDIFEIVYGGSLYSGRRDPTPFLEALCILKQEGVRVLAKFIGQDAVDVVGPMVSSLEIGDLVECRGPVPHDEWLCIAQRASALLILEETTPEAAGNATGKLFEYVGMRKPVIAVAAPGGAIDRVLRRTGLGRVSTSAGELAKAIRALLEGERPQPVEQEIRALSWHALAGRLAGELDRLVAVLG